MQELGNDIEAQQTALEEHQLRFESFDAHHQFKEIDQLNLNHAEPVGHSKLALTGLHSPIEPEQQRQHPPL